MKARLTPAARARFEPVAHRLRPVLVVARGHHEAVPEELCGVAVGVDVGRVGDVVAVALEEAHERELPGGRQVRAAAAFTRRAAQL